MPGMLPRRRDEFEWKLGFYKEAQTPSPYSSVHSTFTVRFARS